MQAKTKRTTPVRSPDYELIRNCVAVAQTHAAFEAGFTADPTGNSDFAADGPPMRPNFIEALSRATQLSAKTAAGLQAKARIVPIVIKSEEPDGAAFFSSFAADVKRFLEPIVRADERGPSCVEQPAQVPHAA